MDANQQNNGLRTLKRYCYKCNKVTVFRKEKLNHLLHISISVLTAGIWLIPYLLLLVRNNRLPWVCLTCGFRRPKPSTSFFRAHYDV
jgi:hypothetical protein